MNDQPMFDERVWAYADLQPDGVKAGKGLMHMVWVGLVIDPEVDEMIGLDCAVIASPFPHVALRQTEEGTAPLSEKRVHFNKAPTWAWAGRKSNRPYAWVAEVVRNVVLTSPEAGDSNADIQTVFSHGERDLCRLHNPFSITKADE